MDLEENQITKEAIGCGQKVNGKQMWDVEKIEGKQWQDGRIYYLIKWRGFSQDENTWEPLQNLEYCKELIRQYELDICKACNTELPKRFYNNPPNIMHQARSKIKVSEQDKRIELQQQKLKEERKNQGSIQNHDVPEKVLYSFKHENDIVFKIQWRPRQGQNQRPEDSFERCNVLRETHPQFIIDYYEKHINFV